MKRYEYIQLQLGMGALERTLKVVSTNEQVIGWIKGEAEEQDVAGKRGHVKASSGLNGRPYFLNIYQMTKDAPIPILRFYWHILGKICELEWEPFSAEGAGANSQNLHLRKEIIT